MIKKVFPVLALCVFSSTLGIGIVSPLLPLYLRDMGATSIWLGIIVASYFISNSVAVPIAGRLSDRRGRKLFLVIGLLAYAIISVGYVWAGTVSHLALVRLIQGIAGAVTIPIAMAYLGDLSPEGEEGRWQGYADAAFFSGFGFGPLLGGVVTENFGMTTAFLSMSSLNLLAALVALVFLPESTRRQTSKEFHLSFKEMSASSMVKGLFSFRVAQALGRGGITAFLPIFASMIGLSTSLIGILLTINILSMTLFTPLGGLLADRFNRRNLIILGNILFTILLAAIPLTTSFWLLLGVLLIHGLSATVSSPAAGALTVEEGRKFGMGSTISILFLAQSLGMALGPIISGGVADLLNIDSVFYLGAVLGIIGTALFIWFTRGYS
ncbi:MAG: MFS transporter [Chloroflexi bacterium]|nr:MFS transporter [Chloroflexota bacterium]